MAVATVDESAPMLTLARTTEKMLIRPLTLDEISLCLPFGYLFHAEKSIPGAFNPDVFTKNWHQFIGSGMGVIFGLWKDEVLIGGIGGFVFPDITSGELVANEFFWFVQKADRRGSWPLRLRSAYKAWAKAMGAIRYRMVHILEPNETPSTVRLAHVYRRDGMRAIEVVYDGLL